MATALATSVLSYSFRHALHSISAYREGTKCSQDCGFVRALGSVERGMKNYGDFSDGNIVCRVQLGSQIHVSRGYWVSALLDLVQSFPMLAMTVCEATNDRGESKYYFKELNTADLHKVLIYYLGSEGFPDASQLFDTRFPSGEFLWRMHVLTEFKEYDGWFTYTISAVFDHTIVDGQSCAMIMKQLHSFLNGRLSYTPMLQFIPAAVDDMVPFTFIPWPLEQVVDGALSVAQRMKLKLWNLNMGLNSYFSTFRPPCSADASVDRKTLIKPLKLTLQETGYFIRRCKQQQCSVTAALTTAAAIAFSRLLQGGNLIKRHTVHANVTVDLRRYIPQDQLKKQVFCAVPMATLTFPVYLGRVGNEGTFYYFWSRARLLSKTLSARVRSKEVLHTWNMSRKLFADRESCHALMTLAREDTKHFGRYGHIFISNLGNVTLENSMGINLEDLQFGTRSDVMGSIFMNYIATINQQLHWNFCYCTHITDQATAEAFLELLREVIVLFAIQDNSRQ